jgi:hypothetical protein
MYGTKEAALRVSVGSSENARAVVTAWSNCDKMRLATLHFSDARVTVLENVALTKGWDAFPAHRVDRAYPASLAVFYVAIHVKDLAASTLPVHPVAVKRGGDGFYDRLAVERACPLNVLADDACLSPRVLTIGTERHLVRLCGVTVPDAKAGRDLLGIDMKLPDLYSTASWFLLTRETPDLASRAPCCSHMGVQVDALGGLSGAHLGLYAEAAIMLPQTLIVARLKMELQLAEPIGQLSVVARDLNLATTPGVTADSRKALLLSATQCLKKIVLKTDMQGGTKLLRRLKGLCTRIATTLRPEMADAQVRELTSDLVQTMSDVRGHGFFKSPVVYLTSLKETANCICDEISDIERGLGRSLASPHDAIPAEVKVVLVTIRTMCFDAMKPLLSRDDPNDTALKQAAENCLKQTKAAVTKDSLKAIADGVGHRTHRSLIESTGQLFAAYLHAGFLRTYCGAWMRIIIKLCSAYADKKEYGPTFYSARIKSGGGTATPLSEFKEELSHEGRHIQLNEDFGGNLKIKQPDISRALILMGIDLSLLFIEPVASFVRDGQVLWSFLLRTYMIADSAAIYYEEPCPALKTLVRSVSHELEIIMDVLSAPLWMEKTKRYRPWRVTSGAALFWAFPRFFETRGCRLGDWNDVVFENAHKQFKMLEHGASSHALRSSYAPL